MAQRILIVEDEPQMCELLESFFSDNGYDVAVALTGERR